MVDKVNGTWNVLRCQACGAMQSNRERAMATRVSVLSECPEIQDWWDYDRNNMSPENLTRGSHYEAYLNCPACKTSFRRDIHSFVATHRDGRILPVACPQCGFSSKGNPEDNLVKVCPDIVNWWDYDANAPFLPEQFSKGSTYVAHLKCPDCGLELYTGIHSLLHTDDAGSVVISHAGRCRKYKAMNSPNNLVTNYPQIKRWWNYAKNAPALPEEYTIFSPFKAHFKCPDCGAESYMRITDAFSFNAAGIPKIFKCAFCAGTRPIPHVNSLAALYPELAAECISIFDTENVFPNSSSRVKWQCRDCGGQWFGLIVNRVNGQKCPYCEGKRLIPGFNSLDVMNPELAAEWAPSNASKPRDFLSDSCNIAIWKCPKCHGEYKARIRDREVGDDSCPYCRDKTPLPGYKAKHPDLVKCEWATLENTFIGVDPDKILDNSTAKAWWKCPICNHLYVMSVKDRLMKEKRGHNACTFCSGRRIPSPRIIL